MKDFIAAPETLDQSPFRGEPKLHIILKPKAIAVIYICKRRSKKNYFRKDQALIGQY